VAARCRRFLEDPELAVEQRNGHEMLLPRRHAPLDQVALALEVDQPHLLPAADDDVAVGALQARAGEHARIALRPPVVDLRRDPAQPGPAILVAATVVLPDPETPMTTTIIGRRASCSSPPWGRG
jgi:hypothetical protein